MKIQSLFIKAEINLMYLDYIDHSKQLDYSLFFSLQKILSIQFHLLHFGIHFLETHGFMKQQEEM